MKYAEVERAVIKVARKFDEGIRDVDLEVEHVGGLYHLKLTLHNIEDRSVGIFDAKQVIEFHQMDHELETVEQPFRLNLWFVNLPCIEDANEAQTFIRTVRAAVEKSFFNHVIMS